MTAAGHETLGEAIHRRRTGMGLSQRALGSAAGVSAAFVSQVEHGHRQPSLDVLQRLAEALDTVPAGLLSSGSDVGEGAVHGATELTAIETLVHDADACATLVAAARRTVDGPRAAELGAYIGIVAEYADFLEAFAQRRYRAMTGPAIVVVAAALSYVVDPEDAWPDAHPHGHLDDVGVLAFTYALVATELAEFHDWQDLVKRSRPASP